MCFDETSKQLIGHTRTPISSEPGRAERYDYEYRRNGTRNLFVLCEPKGGYRHIEVTQGRTTVDFAEQMKCQVDEVYPDRWNDQVGSGQPEHPQAWLPV